MKSFDSLDREELVKLTDEQLGMYVDIECANRGIALLPMKPVDPKATKPEKDTTVFTIDTLHFLNASDAQAVVAFIKQNGFKLVNVSYLSGPSYEHCYSLANVDSALKLDSQQVYSPEAKDTYAELIAVAEQKKSEYDEAKKEYNDVYNERKVVYDEIQQTYTEALVWVEKKRQAKQNYERYLELADGDQQVAKTFFLNAYSSKYPQDILDITVTLAQQSY
jgi:hypothetical protein